MSIIEVKNLHKSYGAIKAVNGVSFSVQKGEIFAILGPNGAGKTTTLEIMEGVKNGDSGQIFVDGIDVLIEPQKVKGIIGVQLQHESFFDYLTLEELLNLFASIYKKETNALEMLKNVELYEKRNSCFNELSGGQKRRFSIAVSLIHEPKIIFLDEPTTGLDPQSRRYVWDLIEKIRSRGATIILTTHYMEEAEKLCDRLAVMDNGEIVAMGTPSELISKLDVKNYISFSSNKYIPLADLEILYGVRQAESSNGFYKLETIDPMATLFRLLQHGYDLKLELFNFSLRQPNLEDVFINLTGHKLRE